MQEYAQRTRAIAVPVTNRAAPLRALALDQDRIGYLKFFEFTPVRTHERTPAQRERAAQMAAHEHRGRGQLYALPTSY